MIRYEQIEVLRKLARVSKMDCWFSIDDEGNFRDLEDNGKKKSLKKAVSSLVDGLTYEDLHSLSLGETRILIYLLGGLLG